ncbi:putative leucine-rich repeat receptor-like protein kinase IMK3 [Capsicum baccatum]|uniref:Leucine-rich repeat receptor-like protein kinase IMK3 n=1 Tax=Capsicum baccatum TaxID=33114 RepID=A0A2G2VZ79_CAPBA|nr:putative leucine-rich repeat receptor-like protein kinase IMK3 [Capsicum baccatum]
MEDVGLSRLMTTNGNTNIIVTTGMLAYHTLEFSKINNSSTNMDAYSLGVIILELLIGNSPSEAIDDLNFTLWVAFIVKEKWTNEVFDVELMRDVPNIGDILLNTLKLAFHCVDPTPTTKHDTLRKATSIPWCEFCGIHGHDTRDCYHLREPVTELLNGGHLKEFLNKRVKGNYGKGTKGNSTPAGSGAPRKAIS